MFIGINCSEQKSILDSGTRTASVCVPEVSADTPVDCTFLCTEIPAETNSCGQARAWFLTQFLIFLYRTAPAALGRSLTR